MTRTQKLILVAIFAILVAAAIFFIFRTPGRGSGAKAVGTPAASLPETASVPVPIPPPRPLTPEEQAVESDKSLGRKVSMVFAERFGSYSNQGLFLNITDLSPLMTASMRAWADNFKREATSKQTSGYAGVTTRALSAVVDEYLGAEGKMRVVVGAQREESTDAGSKVYTQDLTVHMVKDAGVWKVNSIEWGEAR